jgi:hypothetical protein
MAVNPLSSVVLTQTPDLNAGVVPVDINALSPTSNAVSAGALVIVNAGSLDANGAFTPGASATFSTTQLPATLGAKTGANSLSVVPNTDTAFPAVGNVAHDAVDSGNPLKIGGFAMTSAPAAVSDGDRVNAWFSPRGAQFAALTDASGNTSTIQNSGTASIGAINGLAVVTFNRVYNGTNFLNQPGDGNGTVSQPYALTGSRWAYAAPSGGVTTATTTTIIAASASLKNYLTAIDIRSDGAITLALDIEIRAGAGGTVLWRGRLPAGIAALSQTFPCPLATPVNTALVYVTTAIPGVAVYLNAQGFQSAT